MSWVVFWSEFYHNFSEWKIDIQATHSQFQLLPADIPSLAVRNSQRPCPWHRHAVKVKFAPQIKMAEARMGWVESGLILLKHWMGWDPKIGFKWKILETRFGCSSRRAFALDIYSEAILALEVLNGQSYLRWHKPYHLLWHFCFLHTSTHDDLDTDCCNDIAIHHIRQHADESPWRCLQMTGGSLIETWIAIAIDLIENVLKQLRTVPWLHEWPLSAVDRWRKAHAGSFF